jgi:hypothetical protein
MYPLLIISCSIPLERYPLSRHRFCFFLFLFVVDVVVDADDDMDDDGLLIIMLSTVSIATVTSWVFADVITTDKVIPFLSVSICRLVPNLPLSVGLCPVIASLKVILQIYYQVTASSI